MGKKVSDQAIGSFVKALEADLSPERIILFGSRARGDDWKRSDYDFIIISSKFEGMHWLDRISRVVGHWKSLADIDALPYTPKEFKQKSRTSSVVKSALKTGIVISPLKHSDEYYPQERRMVDARLAEADEDIRRGRVYGPFNTAEEMAASVETNVKKLRAAKKKPNRLR